MVCIHQQLYSSAAVIYESSLSYLQWFTCSRSYLPVVWVMICWVDVTYLDRA